MRGRRAINAFVVACVLLVSAACTSDAKTPPSPSALGDDAITIGSFDFPESDLLANIYGQAMRAGGYHVRFAANLGPREFVDPALVRGLIEFVPEYAGTALSFLSRNEVTPSSSAAENHRKLQRVLQGTPIAALAAAPAQDANGFAVTPQTADTYGLSDISDLRDRASRLTFAGPPECPTRPFCLLGLRQIYGLDIKKFIPTDAGGPLTYQALNTRQVDVGLTFTTDPHLANGDLVALRDDLRLQPAENVTPLVHREVLRRWGAKLSGLIDDVSRRLTTKGLQSLNRRVVIDGRRPSVVAAEWLQREGLR